MIDNTITITRWNKSFDWRHADISDTGILSHVKEPGTYILSANAWGLKGHLPGGKHSWVSTFDGHRWKTYEISDIETLEIQGASVFYATENNYSLRQLVVSDRNPGTMWFGNTPRIDYSGPLISLDYQSYPLKTRTNLVTRNCNTFVSYVVWRHGLNFKKRYIGYKSSNFWDKTT